uniref:Uncharacterized protein n=1 Tax=Strigamia maritima TaxID=126957 RepID=T1JM10_STRMM
MSPEGCESNGTQHEQPQTIHFKATKQCNETFFILQLAMPTEKLRAAPRKDEERPRSAITRTEGKRGSNFILRKSNDSNRDIFFNYNSRELEKARKSPSGSIRISFARIKHFSEFN